jgi:alpha-glucosidase (family GH31 glycosyl hydrolase)
MRKVTMKNREKRMVNKSTLKCGDRVRFQILDDRIIRLEWAEDGFFEDRPSLAVMKRESTDVDFESDIIDQKIIIKTKFLTIEYIQNSGKFSPENLSISFVLNGDTAKWYPGEVDDGNLKGTARTLDGIKGSATELGDGFLSRSGWSLFDDSKSVVLEKSESGEPWVVNRPDGDRIDWYFIFCGNNYTQTLLAAKEIFGFQPLPPQWAFGYWWSRYWAYTDKEFEDLVEQFNRMKIPIDILVVDMDWHLEGWTGYTWDRRYFPDPDEFLKWAKSQDLKVTLNLHPAQGVGSHEECFNRIAESMGIDPKSVDRIPFDCTDPKYMKSYFEALHHPFEKKGVDFWWIDWQQGKETKIPGLDPLPWLNYLHWHDMEKNTTRTIDKRTLRPVILSRFGGIGSGRYPIGFSGDTISKWESLEYQPYFTSTAANVLFGYWSHDIGGHMPGEIDPELYLRWIQFGVFSPILRTHTTKNPKAERRVWEYPAPYSILMMDAIRLRYEMIPYIYSEARACCTSGRSICHPLYHIYPKSENAYKAKNQYFFGRSFLMAPIIKPVNQDDDQAETEIWLPKGSWIDTSTGDLFKIENTDGEFIQRNYLISEIPAFVESGTVIPGHVAPLRIKPGSYENLLITVYPGEKGECLLYEDDGISTEYLKDKYAYIWIANVFDQNSREINIYKTEGKYDGIKYKRSCEIRIPCSIPPESVYLGDQELKWEYRLDSAGWSYDGDLATTIIRVPSIDIRKLSQIRVNYGQSINHDLAWGLKGKFARLKLVSYYSTLATSWKITHPDERLPVLAAQTGNRISRNPASFEKEISSLSEIKRSMQRMMPEMLEKVEGEDKINYLRKALRILDSISL